MIAARASWRRRVWVDTDVQVRVTKRRGEVTVVLQLGRAQIEIRAPFARMLADAIHDALDGEPDGS